MFFLFVILGENFIMNLSNNLFKNNVALFGGGGIYFNNKILIESPRENNIFQDNTAHFANDFLTFPMRLALVQSNLSKTRQKPYSLTIVPGMTEISLHFEVIDYFGQTIESINGG